MMLTKEECLEALRDIEFNLPISYINSEYGLFVRRAYVNQIEILKSLIYEHFDNPPLKFEELKEGMWIWDNKLKEWRKVIEKLIVGVSEGSEFYEDIYVKGTKVIRIGLHKFDWKDVLFESKRFYRKEVM